MPRIQKMAKPPAPMTPAQAAQAQRDDDLLASEPLHTIADEVARTAARARAAKRKENT